jgi:Na+/melibiose symporter-like transporter
LLFFTFFTIFNIPWQAMGFEMTDDVKERNSVQAIRSLFASVAALVIGYILPISEYFGQGDAITGLKFTSLAAAIVLILCTLASMFVKESTLPIWMHSEPTPLSISSATTTGIESTRLWATKRPCKWKKKISP